MRRSRPLTHPCVLILRGMERCCGLAERVREDVHHDPVRARIARAAKDAAAEDDDKEEDDEARSLAREPRPWSAAAASM